MSDKSVAERLQVKGVRRLALIGNVAVVDHGVGAFERRAGVAEAEVVLLIAPDLTRLKLDLPGVLVAASQSAIIWVAYPKLSSPLASDLSRDVIHTLAPNYSLDVVSQIAINNDWSAMRMKRVPG